MLASTGGEEEPASDMQHQNKRRKTSHNKGKGPGAVLLSTLLDCGLTLRENARPELDLPNAAFRRRLDMQMTQDSSLIAPFLAEFTTHIGASMVNFRNSLLPLEQRRAKDGSTDTGTVRARGDSLVRSMLSISLLQPVLLNTILDRLAEFCHEDGEEGSLADSMGTEQLMRGSGHAAHQGMTMPRLILTQLRWLDHVVNPKELVRKLLEMVEVTPLDVQREIILYLPEIVDDRASSEVVQGLQAVLESHQELTVPALDALSNLNLSVGAMQEIRCMVLDNLSGYEASSLPVIVRFINQSTPAADAVAVIKSLRENLGFESLSFGTISADSLSASQVVRVHDAQFDNATLTLESIRAGLRFHKSIADAWIKALKGVPKPADCKVLDLFVLFMLRDLSGSKKAIDSLIARKLRDNILSGKLVSGAFDNYSKPLRDYFKQILAVAELLLRSRDADCRKFASVLYLKCFACFEEYCQQEVIGTLITHVGSGSTVEINDALNVILKLTNEHPRQMQRFTIFLKGLLDYVHNLSVPHIRLLFFMLTKLSMLQSAEEGYTMLAGADDDTMILIRKLLMKSTLDDKRLGVIAALTVIRVLYTGRAAGQATEDTPVESEEHAGLDQSRSKSTLELLELIVQNTRHCIPVRALFYDELSPILKHMTLTPELAEFFEEHVAQDFQDFLLTLEEDPVSVLRRHPSVHIERAYVAKDTHDAEVALGFLPKEQHPHLTMVVCPLLKLFQTRERIQEGSLKNIDALQTCAIETISQTTLDSFEILSAQSKDLVCHHLFLMTNWFREILNSFVGEPQPDVKLACIYRLEDLGKVQSLLAGLLAQHSEFAPYPAHFEEDIVAGAKKGGRKKKAASTKPAKAKKKKAKRKRKEADLDNDDDANAGESDQETVVSSVAPQKTQTLDLFAYRHSLREFELSVFEVLKYVMVVDEVDTEMNTKLSQREKLSISAEQCAMLLKDLSMKINRVFHPPKTVPWAAGGNARDLGFGNLLRREPLDVLRFAIGLSPEICTKLELAVNFFTTIIEEHDGVHDMAVFAAHPNTAVYSELLQLGLGIIRDLLEWEGFQSLGNRVHLKSFLGEFAGRMGSMSQSTFEELCVEAFKYLAKFAQAAPAAAVMVTSLRILVCIREFTNPSSPSRASFGKNIAELCSNSVRHSWSQDPRKPIRTDQLTFLLTTLLDLCADPHSVVEAIIFKALPDLIENPEDPRGSEFPTLVKGTFPTYFRICMAKITSLVSTSHVHGQSGLNLISARQVDPAELRVMTSDQLNQLTACCQLFQGCVRISKHEELRSKSFLVCLLKQSRSLLEAFLKSSMPLMDRYFRHHSNAIVNVLKDLQKSTRILQTICSNSKVEQDMSLTSHVPPLKKCLEEIVFGVKSMLLKNNCEAAFWLGNLRNKDLQGKVVPSQVQGGSNDESGSESDSDGEEEDEEDPDDYV